MTRQWTSAMGERWRLRRQREEEEHDRLHAELLAACRSFKAGSDVHVSAACMAVYGDVIKRRRKLMEEGE